MLRWAWAQPCVQIQHGLTTSEAAGLGQGFGKEKKKKESTETYEYFQPQKMGKRRSLCSAEV